MSIKRCNSCNGQKKVTPLGFIQKECPACKGIGFISLDSKKYKTDDVLENLNDNKDITIIKKKRGRPSSKLIVDSNR